MIEPISKRVPFFRGVLGAFALILLSLSLGGCGESAVPAAADEQLASEQVAGEPPDWRQDRLQLGQETYEQACASCHDDGRDGAPRTGVREDWEDRSKMWQAVLFNHAKAGYLNMPGKGGQPDLSDEAVEAASEYMLGLTFPELPRD